MMPFSYFGDKEHHTFEQLSFFFFQILVISKFSKLSWNISLSITGLKSTLIHKCVNERFTDSLCIENHAGYFWDIRLKLLRLPNFNMLFQLVLTRFFKSELFSFLPKVGHVIKSCKEPNRVFSFTWPAYMQIYCNRRNRLHKKRVQLPED